MSDESKHLIEQDEIKHSGTRRGRNLKFRILCKRCNSYQHTLVYAGDNAAVRIVCTKCNNTADSFEEEADVS